MLTYTLIFLSTPIPNIEDSVIQDIEINEDDANEENEERTMSK